MDELVAIAAPLLVGTVIVVYTVETIKLHWEAIVQFAFITLGTSILLAIIALVGAAVIAATRETWAEHRTRVQMQKALQALGANAQQVGNSATRAASQGAGPASGSPQLPTHQKGKKW